MHTKNKALKEIYKIICLKYHALSLKECHVLSGQYAANISVDAFLESKIVRRYLKIYI